MLKSWILMILAIISVTVATPAVAQETPGPAPPACKDAPNLRPGQKGYLHCQYHKHYQEVFTLTNCKCTTGQCRATEWYTDGRSPVGIAVKIDGKRCPLTWFINPRGVKVPPELLTEAAHVCVEDGSPLDADGCPTNINCAIINNGV